jgi:serine protease Do
MLKKIVLMVVACVVVMTVVGSNGYADDRFGNIEALGAVIVQLEQRAAQQEQQINDLLEKTNDEQNTINAVKKNVQSLVRITSDTEIGSGFFVKPNLILTAYHVIEGSTDVRIDMYTGKTIIGKVINHDSKNDIAMIEVTDLGIPVTINTDIHVGQTEISYGYPMGIDATANKGIVSAINNDIQISSPVNNGDSGGMLLDSNGDVIGLVKSRLSSISNGAEHTDVYLVGYATSAVDINLFLRRFK